MTKVFYIHVHLRYTCRETITEEEAMERYGTTDAEEIRDKIEDDAIDNLQEYYDDADFDDVNVEVDEN